MNIIVAFSPTDRYSKLIPFHCWKYIDMINFFYFFYYYKNCLYRRGSAIILLVFHTRPVLDHWATFCGGGGGGGHHNVHFRSCCLQDSNPCSSSLYHKCQRPNHVGHPDPLSRFRGHQFLLSKSDFIIIDIMAYYLRFSSRSFPFTDTHDFS